LKGYIKTHFLAVMLALALLLTACGGAASQSVSEETASSPSVTSGATIEIAQKPLTDEIIASGTYGRVTAIDGDTPTIATGSYNGGKRPDGEAPSGSMPADLGTPPDAPSGSMPNDAASAPSGVDIGGGKGGEFTEDGESVTVTLTDSVKITIQSGMSTAEAAAADIAQGDIVIIDGSTAAPTAITIVRTPKK
jgi:ABC-type Fe3+-hydroxamate transport system substrate-binding protein